MRQTNRGSQNVSTRYSANGQEWSRMLHPFKNCPHRCQMLYFQVIPVKNLLWNTGSKIGDLTRL